MFTQIADSPSEGAMEGASALNDRYVQFMEARLETTNQAQMLFQGDASSGIPSSFPEAKITPDSISFGSGIENGLPKIDLSSMNLGSFGESISSLIESALQLPGPMGLLTQLFQFLSALFTSAMQVLMDPSLLAAQAQATALSMKKLLQP